ncbi:uncharacterized protein LOC8267950 [Ricinus communis]|uniref:Transferase, putative n=1 Tax=Ricinus communis TaxID=3988 RepID=B9T0L5_RICCO|nr:uncharacterized protein LOC8267950 [Ricinus communis]EEF30598.1 transferase, putative [Ricinus communis]|eukprot:XP_002531784.1 uncharacterized protein LOC8267950 [Ricinus communis]
MEMPNISTTNVVPKPQIEAIQTVPPFVVTDPRQFRQVSVAKEPIGSGIFKGCFNIVLCYNKAMEKDSGWLVAGWIKESLARALKEQPLLSGRLRRGEDGHGELEIVSNDSGVRLLEAKINNMSLQEFLDLKERDKAEAELVFWKDIDEQNPQFSPLFYVQVTNFQCGGYSVGISCSFLLADLLIMDNFLQKWAKIQSEMISKNEGPEVPIFYLPNLKPANLSPNSIFSSTPRENCGQTMIFRMSTESMDLKEQSFKKLALLCLEEAEQTGRKILPDEFTFFVKESTKIIKVENCKKTEVAKSHMKNQIMSSCASLKDYLGMNELAFREGNGPARVSLWIGSVTSNGIVVGIPFPKEGSSEVNIIVTIPYENES